MKGSEAKTRLKMSAISIRWRRSPNFTFEDAQDFVKDRCDIMDSFVIANQITASTPSELMGLIAPETEQQRHIVSLLRPIFLLQLQDRINLISKSLVQFTHRLTETRMIGALKLTLLIEFKKTDPGLVLFDHIKNLFVSEHISSPEVRFELSLYAIVLGPDLSDATDDMPKVLCADAYDSRPIICTHQSYPEFELIDTYTPYRCEIPRNKVLYTYDPESRQMCTYRSDRKLPATFGSSRIKWKSGRCQTVPIIIPCSY